MARVKTALGADKGKGLSSGGVLSAALAGGTGVLAGVLAVVLALGLAAPAPGASSGEPGQVRLTPVDPAQFEAALQTIAPELRDQTRQDIAACKTALFMMEVGPMPGASEPPSGYVQIKLGAYTSPRFAVGARPMGFAVPHPIPDAKTVLQGIVIVTGTARAARVSFTPPVDYPVLVGAVNQPVFYDVPQACGLDQGKVKG